MKTLDPILFRRLEEARLFGGSVDEILSELPSPEEGLPYLEILNIKQEPPKLRLKKLRKFFSQFQHPLPLGCAYLEMGVAYLELGQALKAEPLLRKAVELLQKGGFEPKRLIAHYNLLLSQIYLGRSVQESEARGLLERMRAVKARPEDLFYKFVLRAQYTLAWLLYYFWGEAEEALRLLSDPYLSLHPEEEKEFNLLKAVIKFWEGNLTLKELNALLSPNLPDYSGLKAGLLALKGDPKALEVVKSARFGTLNGLLAEAFVLYCFGRYAEASEKIAVLLRKLPETIDSPLAFDAACLGLLSASKARLPLFFEFLNLYSRLRRVFKPHFERETLRKIDEIFLGNQLKTKVWILGRFRIEGHGQVADLKLTRPIRAFLYLLMAKGRWISKEELGSMVWPETPPMSSGRIRVVIKRARDALRPFGVRIEQKGGKYRVNYEEIWVDAFQLLELNLRGKISEIVENLDLYQGPVLGGTDDVYLKGLEEEVQKAALRAVKRVLEAWGTEKVLSLVREMANRGEFPRSLARVYAQAFAELGEEETAREIHSLL